MKRIGQCIQYLRRVHLVAVGRLRMTGTGMTVKEQTVAGGGDVEELGEIV